MPVAAAHVELHEGAGQLVLFPWCGMFAGPQTDDRIADPHCLTRFQRHIATDTVALVEQADDRDPLRHRRAAGRQRHVAGCHRLDGVGGGADTGCQILRDHALPDRVGTVQRAVAEHPRHHQRHQRHQQHAGGKPASRHPSGVHAS
ncbi:hypothetical protein GCM10009102_18690 [Sphingomonas insulae]|uniref:Uncharacterized protein n=1 Tax=Sphingomonas insulae TaxID=424800 RepID=A0ABN1HUW9_9SPHN